MQNWEDYKMSFKVVWLNIREITILEFMTLDRYLNMHISMPGKYIIRPENKLGGL